jgi:hypothetical protein
MGSDEATSGPPTAEQAAFGSAYLSPFSSKPMPSPPQEWRLHMAIVTV